MKIKHLTSIKIDDFYPIVALSAIVTILNVMTIGSALGMIVAIPQIIYVYYLILTSRYQKAFFWHLVFITLSISGGIAAGILGYGHPFRLHNYANLKIAGPVSLSYLTTLLIFCLNIHKTISKNSGTLLYRLLLVLIFMAVSGGLIGIFGLIFDSSYSWERFLMLNIYIWMTIITIWTSLKLSDNNQFKYYYERCLPVIEGGIIGAFSVFLFGFTTSYGGISEIPLIPDSVYYAPLVILSLFFVKEHRKFTIFSLILYLFLCTKNMGGKSVIIFAFAVLYSFYIILFDKEFRIRNRQKMKYIIPAALLFSIGIISVLPSVMLDDQSVARRKIESVVALLRMDFDNGVATSPFIRVAESYNFVYNNRRNPIALLFGRGYGGYFTDELGLLNGLDLSGGWDEETIRSGKFTSAHDTFSQVPLSNGFIGLFAILYMGWLYVKRIKVNYLAFAAVPWLMLTFYFSPMLAFIAIFLLTGAEYNPK